MRIIFFLSSLLFLGICTAKGQKPILVEAHYAIDSNSTWKVAELSTKDFKPFFPREQLVIGYNTNTSVWCRFTVKNDDPAERVSKWLSFNNVHIDSLALFENSKLAGVLGDRTTSVSPYLDAPAFPINLQPGEERIFYVQVKKQISYLEFSFQFSDGRELARKSDIKIGLISFFLGIIFLLILFNSILFYISRRRLFLYYIFYSVLSAAYIVVSTSYAKQLLFSDFLYYSECRIYLASLWFIALSAFFCHFINIRIHQPRKYKAILYVNYINLSFIIISIGCLFSGNLGPLKTLTIIGYVNFLVIMVLVCWSTVLHLRIDKQSALYLILSFLPQTLWGAGVILKSFALIHSDVHIDWLVVIFLYEVLLFGYILTKNYMEAFLRNNLLIEEIVAEKEKSLQAISQVQIRERRTIANIIHDNFGSKIAYILQLLQLKDYKIANDHIKELAGEIREISHQILPKSLDDGALISSLKSQIDSLNAGFRHARIELYSYDFPEKLEELWIYDLYLVALEIINNALKHGEAKTISIELYQYPEYYSFQFTDDGIGFDTRQVPKGFGLDNIEKRIHYYEGEFEISSILEQGTVIQISIPKK